MSFVEFHSAGFFYPSSITPVLRDLTVRFSPGWTGITGDNGAGKTTLLLLAAALEQPSSGTIRGAGGLYCSQRTGDRPALWESFFYSGDREAERLMNRLRIKPGEGERWDTLSHGERKRIQLAAALWEHPPVLAVDEPTNHLDREGRDLVIAALETYEGVGLLVSHDRTLLDRLCGNCFFIRRGGGVLRPGGISRGLEEEERERLERERRRNKVQNERDRLAAETDRRRRDAESAKNRLSKKNLDRLDHDTRGKINLARLSGKDTHSARLYTTMRRRTERLDKTVEGIFPAGEGKRGLTLDTRRARADYLYRSAGGTLPLGERRVLRFPGIEIYPESRVALTGPNGAGKSTLLGHIMKELPPRIRQPVFFMPQEISPAESGRLLKEVLGEDEKSRGEILSRFSRLGSDPAALLQSRLPSPGEIRKLMIARGVFARPALVIMDEPTNHLDLTSIGLLEKALEETAGALLLVSHDDVFLSRLTESQWTIRREGDDAELYLGL